VGVEPSRRGFVLVSGPPASGKSTLAVELGASLELPVLAKDVVKDALIDTLGAVDVQQSRNMGTVAVRVLIAVARSVGYGIVESVWHRYALDLLSELPGSVVEVHCRCDTLVLRQRYQSRSQGRHAGYFDAERDPAELWNVEVGSPIGGEWPMIVVDTTRPVDSGDVASQVLRLW